MRIPVFVSCPSDLNDEQKKSRDFILDQLERSALEPRTVGQTDYPTKSPLREVLILAQHCSGGVILGFEQAFAPTALVKRGTEPRGKKPKEKSPALFPTPWNHIEAGILFALNLPLIVFREEGIDGGIFGLGVTDVFIQPMPKTPMTPESAEKLAAIFQRWQAAVRFHYYGGV